jgi:toxin ParE1/3/4
MDLAWTQTALDDLAAVRSWLGRDSKPLADRVIETLLTGIERVLPFPRIGRVVAEVGDESVRELLLRTFRLVYRIEGDRIVVLSILHGGRATERREPRRWEVY